MPQSHTTSTQSQWPELRVTIGITSTWTRPLPSKGSAESPEESPGCCMPTPFSSSCWSTPGTGKLPGAAWRIVGQLSMGQFPRDNSGSPRDSCPVPSLEHRGTTDSGTCSQGRDISPGSHPHILLGLSHWTCAAHAGFAAGPAPKAQLWPSLRPGPSPGHHNRGLGVTLTKCSLPAPITTRDLGCFFFIISFKFLPPQHSSFPRSNVIILHETAQV